MSSALLHLFCVTVTQGGTPSVAFGNKCFPGLWRDVEARHVTLDDVFILYSAVWVCQFYEACCRIRRKGYPWAGNHPHAMDKGKPAQTSLPHNGDQVI